MTKSTDKALAESLGRVPLFSQCSPKDLRTIVRSGKIVKRASDTEVVREGRGGVVFFVVLSGAVEVSRDGQPLAQLLVGDCFGEMALLTDQRRNATVVAKTDIELFALSQWDFKAMVLENPQLAYELLCTIAARVDAS